MAQYLFSPREKRYGALCVINWSPNFKYGTDDFQIKSLETESHYLKSSFQILGDVWGPDRTTFV